MVKQDKTVFISYRRKTSGTEAHVIRRFLQQNGYDVFLDVTSLPAGEFSPELLTNIETRSIFLVILMPGTLNQCINDDGTPNVDDWVRREIEHAIYMKRLIVPVLMGDFNFQDNEHYLTGTLNQLTSFTGIPINHHYFDEGLNRLLEFLETRFTSAQQTILPPEEMAASVRVEVIITPPEATPEEIRAEQLYGSAMNRYLQNDFHGAIADFTEAIHLVPRFAAAYGHRAIMRKNLDDLDGAIADYTQAINFSADYPLYAEYYYHNRGISYHIKGEYEHAIADYTNAIHLNPLFSEAFSRRGTSKSRKGDLQGAIEDYNEAIRIAPEDCMPVINRGTVYAELGNFDAALEDYNKGIGLGPDTWEGYNNRGLAYIELRNFDAAIEDFEKAISLHPDLPDIHVSLANALAEKGDLALAINVCTNVLRTYPEDAGIIAFRGWLNYLSGNPEDGISDFEASLQIDPNRPETHNDLGVTLSSLGRLNEARDHYTKAIELNHPKLQWPYANRGGIHTTQGQIEQAISDCTEAIRIDPTYPNAYRVRAEAHKAAGNLAEAVQDYQKYLDLGGWHKYGDKSFVESIIRDLNSRRDQD